MKVRINGETKEMRALWYDDGVINFLDQRKIPDSIEIFQARNYRDVAFAIKEMVVRGAPAIGVSAAYGIAQAKEQRLNIREVAEILSSTRPTAYDLFFAINYMLET